MSHTLFCFHVHARPYKNAHVVATTIYRAVYFVFKSFYVIIDSLRFLREICYKKIAETQSVLDIRRHKITKKISE